MTLLKGVQPASHHHQLVINDLCQEVVARCQQFPNLVPLILLLLIAQDVTTRHIVDQAPNREETVVEADAG